MVGKKGLIHYSLMYITGLFGFSVNYCGFSGERSIRESITIMSVAMGDKYH